MKKLLKLSLLVVTSFFPRKLPIGMTKFNEWVQDIVLISGLPNNSTTRGLAATFILQIPPNIGYISIRRVSDMLVKAAANQVGAEVIKLNIEASNEKAESKEVN